MEEVSLYNEIKRGSALLNYAAKILQKQLYILFLNVGPERYFGNKTLITHFPASFRHATYSIIRLNCLGGFQTYIYRSYMIAYQTHDDEIFFFCLTWEFSSPGPWLYISRYFTSLEKCVVWKFKKKHLQAKLDVTQMLMVPS